MNIPNLIQYVSDHLIKQGCQSTAKDSPKGKYLGCAYRGDEGRMCAIGALIPDDLYSSKIENKTIAQLAYDSDYDDFWKAFIQHLETKFPGDRQLTDSYLISVLDELQNIHDQHPPENWEELLRGYILGIRVRS